MQSTVGQNAILIPDPSRFTLQPRVDIYPDEAQRLDVAAKFNYESNVYGWSNEEYFSNPVWRNPAWALRPGRYLVKVQ
jgi:hypothetical protein